MSLLTVLKTNSENSFENYLYLKKNHMTIIIIFIYFKMKIVENN